MAGGKTLEPRVQVLFLITHRSKDRHLKTKGFHAEPMMIAELETSATGQTIHFQKYSLFRLLSVGYSFSLIHLRYISLRNINPSARIISPCVRHAVGLMYLFDLHWCSFWDVACNNFINKGGASQEYCRSDKKCIYCIRSSADLRTWFQIISLCS